MNSEISISSFNYKVQVPIQRKGVNHLHLGFQRRFSCSEGKRLFRVSAPQTIKGILFYSLLQYIQTA